MLSAIYDDYMELGSGASPQRVGDDGRMPRFVPVEDLFRCRHFDQEIVVLCVRWYLSFKLSYRDLVAMMSERGIDMAHTTILRWVQHYTPEFEKRWKRYARSVGGSWRIVVLVNSDVADKLRIGHLPSTPVRNRIFGDVRDSCGVISEPAALQFEILALRHQLRVLQRSVKRPKLTASD
jgi:hypothetical protein